MKCIYVGTNHSEFCGKCDTDFGCPSLVEEKIKEKSGKMKFLQLFKKKRIRPRPEARETLSVDKMIFRWSEHTQLGAKLRKDNLGRIVALEIWDVGFFPDDGATVRYEIFPSGIKVLKDFIKLFECTLENERKPHG
jgi:hypothetical protein